MAAPMATEAEAKDSAEPSAGGVDKPAADKAVTDTDSAAQAAWAKKLPAVADIAGCVSQAQDITSAICDQGLANLSARFHMQLLALVRTTRVVGLPRLERAITALATLSQDARVGKPVARGEVARQLFAVAMVTHLLDRYGDETPALLQAIDAAGPEERLGEPLAEAPTYLRAEVAWAVTHEGAESLDDVLLRRVRLDLSRRDRGLAAADEILAIMAPLLNWSEKDVAAQKEAYAQRVAQIAAAEAELTDAAAVAHITEPI